MLLTELSESINGPRPKKPGPKAGRPLSDRVDELDKKVDKLDTRVSGVQFGLATLAADAKRQFREIDTERIHSELTGRIVDLETPGTEGRGGSGTGVPPAS